MLLTNLVCWLVLWPLLVLRLGAPHKLIARRPAQRPVRRQWAVAGRLGRRVVAVRLQVVYA